VSESKEDKRRWGIALQAIDEGLESEEPAEQLLAAIGWALTDIADSLDVISQHVEIVGASRPKPPRKRGKGKPEEVEEEEEEEEEDEPE